MTTIRFTIDVNVLDDAKLTSATTKTQLSDIAKELMNIADNSVSDNADLDTISCDADCTIMSE